MKRALRFCLWLTMVFAFPSMAAYAQNHADTCRLETKYDREMNSTTVECALLESFMPPIRLMVQANASFQGKRPNETAKFQLSLAAFRNGSNRHTTPLFKDATTLLLNLGTSHLEIPVTEFRTEFFEMNRLLAEQANAAVSGEDLRKLLQAKSLKGKWGNTEFDLSETALASLKTFISGQMFAAPSQ